MSRPMTVTVLANETNLEEVLVRVSGAPSQLSAFSKMFRDWCSDHKLWEGIDWCFERGVYGLIVRLDQLTDSDLIELKLTFQGYSG